MKRLFGVRAPAVRTDLPRVSLAVTLVIVGFALAFFRIPAESRERMWAEDGAVFLEAAISSPNPGVILQPYAGYLHLLPRLIADLVARVPVEAAPLVLSVTLALATSLLGAAAFFFSAAHVTSLVPRLLIWLLVVASPLAGWEIALSSANLQWYLLGITLLAVFGRRPGGLATTTTVLVLVVAFGSSILALIFLPFVLLRAVLFRRRSDIIIAGVGTLVAAAQVVAAVSTTRNIGASPFDGLDLLGMYSVDVVLSAWIGPSLTVALTSAGPAVALGAGILLAMLTIALAIAVWKRTPLAGISLGIAAAYYLVVSVLTSVPAWGITALLVQGVGTRYLIFPVFTVGIVIAVVIDVLLMRRTTLATVVAVGLVFVQLLAVGSSYRAFDVRAAQQPTDRAWRDVIVSARAECGAGAEEVYLRGGPEWPNDWDNFIVPCTYVLR